MSAQTNGQDHGKPRRVILLSIPRSASHLLMRMLTLDHQPTFASHPPEGQDYFFMPAARIQMQLAQFKQDQHELTSEDKASLMEIYQSCASNMESFLNTAAAQGKSSFFKEHVALIKTPVPAGDKGDDEP